MPAKRAQRSRSRQTTPQSPPKQNAPQPSPRQTRRDTRSKSREIIEASPAPKRADKSLSPVDEEDDSINEVEEEQPELPFDSGIEDEPSSNRSSLEDDIDDSSSDNETQLETLDLDLIIDTLPALYQASNQILSLIASTKLDELVREIRQPTSKISKRLHNLFTLFNASRQVYGSQSYIDIHLILRKLTSNSNPENGPWRPDAVLQQANLGLLAAGLAQQDETSIYDTLERMFNSFPNPFGQSSMAVGQTTHSSLPVSHTIAFGIALRTQFFIKVVQRSMDDPAFDPESVLDKVFYDDDGILRGFQAEGEEVLFEAEAAILQQLDSIRESFTKDSSDSVNLDQLKRKFSWPRFLKLAFQWITMRKQELANHISAQGGVHGITQRLEQNDLGPYKDSAPYAQHTPDMLRSGNHMLKSQEKQRTQQSLGGLSNSRLSSNSVMASRVKRLKSLKRQQDDGSSESGNSDTGAGRVPTSAQHTTPLKNASRVQRFAAAEIPQSPGVTFQEDNLIGGDEGEDLPDVRQLLDQSPPRPTQGSIVPTQQTLAVLEVARQHAVLGNKENIDTTRRYTHRQPNARRLEWDDSQAGKKRGRVDTDDEVEEEEDDDDEGDIEFETDLRPQKRPRLPRPPSPHTVNRWAGESVEEESDEEISQRQQSEEIRTPRLRARPPPSTQPNPQSSPLQRRSVASTPRPPSSSAPQPQARSNRHQHTVTSNEEAPSDRASEHRNVNAQAKHMVRMQPILNPDPASNKPTQVRRAWTAQEIDRLLEMIADHGCAWSHIMKMDKEHPDGPKLQSRGQVQLKDKARNIKMDYLKAGHQLPEGFAAVTIKVADKTLLAQMGLPYEAEL